MKSTTIIFSALLTLFLFTFSSGCAYKAPIQQGNVLKQKDVDEIKPGMSKRQIAIILGTPAIADPFTQNRWDFINTTKIKGVTKDIKRLSLFFKDDKLVRTEGNYFPEKNSESLNSDSDSDSDAESD